MVDDNLPSLFSQQQAKCRNQVAVVLSDYFLCFIQGRFVGLSMSQDPCCSVQLSFLL